MSNANKNIRNDRLFSFFGLFCTFIGLLLLLIFIANIAIEGLPRLSWDFIFGLPSRKWEIAGILPAWTGTVWILVMTAIFVIPIGVGSGVYLEEYANKSRFNRLLEINIFNLAGIPSVIYGIIGLQIFVRILNLGSVLLAGAFTLALLILPIIIVATREAIRSVPRSIKDASYALGASQWQTIWYHVLPIARANIITGIILALARAIGETAPLIIIGALAYIPFAPSSPLDEFTVLPIRIYNWASRSQHGFLINASAAILVLLLFIFLLNGIAVYIRSRSRKKYRM